MPTLRCTNGGKFKSCVNFGTSFTKRYQQQLTNLNRFLFERDQKEVELKDATQSDFSSRHWSITYGKNGSRHVGTQLGVSTPCDLLTILSSFRLPLICIDRSRTCSASARHTVISTRDNNSSRDPQQELYGYWCCILLEPASIHTKSFQKVSRVYPQFLRARFNNYSWIRLKDALRPATSIEHQLIAVIHHG